MGTAIEAKHLRFFVGLLFCELNRHSNLTMFQSYCQENTPTAPLASNVQTVFDALQHKIFGRLVRLIEVVLIGIFHQQNSGWWRIPTRTELRLPNVAHFVESASVFAYICCYVRFVQLLNLTKTKVTRLDLSQSGLAGFLPVEVFGVSSPNCL